MKNLFKIALFWSIVCCNLTRSFGEDFYVFNKSSVLLEQCDDDPDQYRCFDGTCIRKTQYCNGVIDCQGTAEDETHCKRCPPGFCQNKLEISLCNVDKSGDSYDPNEDLDLYNICDMTVQNMANCTGKAMVSLPCIFFFFKFGTLILNKNSFGLFDSLSDVSFQDLHNVSTLELEHNNITYLPSKLFQNCKMLNRLSLAHNQIEHLNDTVFRHLYNLKDLVHGNITGTSCYLDFSHQLSHPTNTRLSVEGMGGRNLDDNKITNLTPNLFQDLIDLNELRLSNNQIEYLDEDIFKNTSRLSIVELSKNNIKMLPLGIFSNLIVEELALDGNRIRTLDEMIFQNPLHLQWLYLDNNNIAALPSNIFRNMKNLRALSLNNNRIAHLDEDIFRDLHESYYLSLQNNNIANLSSNTFRNSRSLSILDISNNLIEYLHETLFHRLSNLNILFLDHNEIVHLPGNLFRDLTNLTHLSLTNNRIENLDEIVFQNLHNLEELFLDHNEIVHLPANLFRDLTNLTSLRLTNNRIEKLDEIVFQNLHNLEELDLADNRIEHLPSKVFHNLKNLKTLLLSNNKLRNLNEIVFLNLNAMNVLDLNENNITDLPAKVFHGLTNLNELRLKNNRIRLLYSTVFEHLHYLQRLDLARNNITHFPVDVFGNLVNLFLLRLENNRIEYVQDVLFKNLFNLRRLDICHNRLSKLPSYMLKNCQHLRSLNLSSNAIEIIEEFSFAGLFRLSELNLKNNEISDVNANIFKDLRNLTSLKADDFRFCCLKKDAKCEAADDKFSSCEDLMKNIVLRIFVRAMGIIAICANVFVIAARLRYQNAKTNKVNLFLIVNLAISDLMMGVYLLIIATTDAIYRGEYYLHDLPWRRSYLCDFVGVLSTFSSELTVFILTVISIDRLLSITFPVRMIQRGIRQTKILMVGVWVLATIISIVPHQMFGIPYFKHFYGRSGVCLALHITEDKPNGWEYSVSVFIILNAIAFTVIAITYVLMYCQASRKSRGTIMSSNQSSDTVMAFRMTLLVLADAACWIPIIILGVRSLIGYPLSHDVYVWIAVFVLPLNAALNPILYTLSSIPLIIEAKFEDCPDNSQPHLRLCWRGLQLKAIQK